MDKGPILYDGKAKIIYATDDPNLAVMYFKDDVVTFEGTKRGVIAGKGACNAQISAVLFQLLDQMGMATHFIRSLNEREHLVHRTKIKPIEFVVRNVVAGSLAGRLGLEEGLQLLEPVLEFYYKGEGTQYPLVNHDHLRVLGVITEEDLEAASVLSLQINNVLRTFFARRGLTLVDYKLEFGTDGQKVMLADEISPDTCRLWDTQTADRLDKDRFRRDLGGVEEAYREVLKRVTGGENAPEQW